MDLAFKFAEHAVRSRFEDLPGEVMRKTGALILDTIGAAIAGSSAEGIDAGLQWIRDNGGAPQATVMAFGDRLPATAVAMINGAMCQARDFDPVYEPGVLLPYGPILAAALAAGEVADASGKDLLHAVILGTDLTCRIGRSVAGGLGWSRTATLGVFGAALACARLLRLDEAQTVHALGLAFSRAAGNIQTVIDGSLAKRYQGGFTAEAGVQAALLAARGITGPRNIFEGRCGFFALYEPGGVRKDRVVEGLGESFEGAESSIKPFPCAREHHGAVAAALQLHAGGVRAADIDSAVVTLTPNAFLLSGKPFPPGGRNTVGDAIGSAAYAVAVALLRGRLALEDFQAEAFSRPETLALIERIEVRQDSGVRDAKTLVPQSVSVRLRGGTVREATVPGMPGSPGYPLSERDLRAKFEACLQASARPLPAGRAASIAQAVAGLHQLAHVRDLKGFT